MSSPTLCALTLLALVGCGHEVSIRRGGDFTVYETHGGHVYVASAFRRELVGPQPAAEYRSFYDRTLAELGTLIERHVLTAEMFFEALGETPPDSGVRNIHRRELTDVDEALAADPGPIVKVLNYVDESDPSVPQRRRYDLWVTFNPGETGWGSFHHFTLEIENGTAPNATGRAFALGARLVSLDYRGEEL